MIDVQKEELKLRVQNDEVKFGVFNVVWNPAVSDACFMIEAMEAIVSSHSGSTNPVDTRFM